MTLLDKVYINVDQHPNWCLSDDPREKREAMRPVLDCLAILGIAPAKSTTIIVSDQYLSGASDEILMSAPPHWITDRWTVKEKRLWVAGVESAIEIRNFSVGMERIRVKGHGKESSDLDGFHERVGVAW